MRKDIRSLVCFVVSCIFVLCLILFALFVGDSDFIVNAESNNVALSTIFPDAENRIISQQGYEESSQFEEDSFYQNILAGGEPLSSTLFDGDTSNGEAYISSDNSYSVSYPYDGSIYNQIERTDTISPATSELCFIYYNGNGTFTLECYSNASLCNTDIFFVNCDGQNIITSSEFYPYYGGMGSQYYWLLKAQYIGTMSGNDLIFTKQSSMAISSYTPTGNTYEYVNDETGQHLNLNMGIGNYVLGGSGLSICLSNNPLYSTLDGDNASTALIVWRDSPTLVDVNYISESSDNTYPDGSGGTSANNLYLDSADWVFRHKTYYAPYSSVINTGSPTPEGVISFVAEPNDYQVDNADQFDLVINYTFDFDVNYQNTSSQDIGPFKKTNSLLGNKKNLKLSFNSTEITYPFADFIDNNNQYNISFDDCFGLLTAQGYSLKGLLAQMKELESVEYNKFNLYCTAHLVSNGASSGGCSEWYNPINKTGYTNDDSIGTNKHPYLPDASDQASDDPDSTNINPTPNVPGGAGTNGGGNSSSNSNAVNNITITNNNTNNNDSSAINTVNNSSGNPFSTLIDKLFGTGTVQEGSIGGNTQDKLVTQTGASNWLQVMSDSFSFIPVSVWSELTLFLGVTLSILVVGFILRIILDFL